MHFQMLVTLSQPAEMSSENVRHTVFESLQNDESFCGDGGRFGCPLSDWFVIGGRWSGFLAETLIGEAFRKALAARFPDLPQPICPAELATDRQEELDALWAGCGGSVPNPYSRSGYEEYGRDDDAMLLTRELYDRLLSEWEGSATEQDGGHCEYADLDGEVLPPEFIGQKWLVVVDYHN